jgi:hypothetical protein
LRPACEQAYIASGDIVPTGILSANTLPNPNNTVPNPNNTLPGRDREGVTMALAGPPNATKTRHNGIPGINSLDRVFNGAAFAF